MAKADKDHADRLFNTVSTEVKEVKERVSSLERVQSILEQPQIDKSQIEDIIKEAVAPLQEAIEQLKAAVEQTELSLLEQSISPPARTIALCRGF